MDQERWTTFCCNPFGRAKHSRQKKNLRPVLPWMREKPPSLPLKAKVCDDCRKKLTMAPLPRSESEEVVESSEEVVESGEEDNASSEQEEVFYQQESLQPLNQCLTAIGETPIAKKEATTSQISQTEAEEN